MSNGRGSVVNRTEDAGTDELREFRMAIAKLTRKGLQTDKSFGVLQNRVEKMPGKIAKDVEHMMQAKQALKAKSTPDALLKEKQAAEDSFVGKGTHVSVKGGSFEKQHRANRYIVGLTKQGTDWATLTSKEHDATCASYQANQQLSNTISLPSSPSARAMSARNRDKRILYEREQRQTYAKDMERERKEAATGREDYEEFSYDDDDDEDEDNFLQRKLAAQKRALRQQSQMALSVRDDHGLTKHLYVTPQMRVHELQQKIKQKFRQNGNREGYTFWVIRSGEKVYLDDPGKSLLQCGVLRANENVRYGLPVSPQKIKQ